MIDLHKQDWNLLAAWRGLAALLVAIGHMVQVIIYPTSVWLAPYSGLLAQASVMIFFVISGCSIAASGFSIAEESQPVRRYIWHRMTRIWPPLLFSITLMWCLWQLAPLMFPSGTADFLPGVRLAREGFHFEWTKAGIALLFLNGFAGSTILTNGPLWSLSYEVWLYFIFFFFLLGLKTRFRWLSVLSLVVFLLLATLDRTGGSLIFVRYSLVWSTGTVVFLLLSQGREQQYRVFLIFPAGLMGLFAFYLARSFVLHDMNEDIWPFNVVLGVFFALYLAMRPSLYPILQYVGVRISKFGYTLYLIHFPIFLFAFGVYQHAIVGSPLAAWGIGIAALVTSMVLAYFSAKLLENRKLFLNLVKLD